MATHLRRDLDALKRELLGVGTLVEDAARKAIEALMYRRADLAQEVMHGDHVIDEREVAVEEDCLKVLALHQPAASDLRFIVAVMKVNNDLERMGDLAVNIAERASYLATHEPLPLRLDFPGMGRAVKAMVHDSIEAVVRRDTALAHSVRASDDLVDDANRQMFEALQDLMMKDTSMIKRAVHALSASRHLERIADLATNIAEDVIFMVDGEVIRHRPEHYE